MKLAVIDCGTNTFNLLILEIKNAAIHKKLFSTRESVKLGQGVTKNGFISQQAFDRALHAINIFNSHIKFFEVDNIIAYATSGIREAPNGFEFINRAKVKYNISIEVIDGLREANFIFLGVNKAVSFNEHVSLIMDIGGGSVEFILVQNKKIIWKESFKIGAARILELFNPSNPIRANEIEAIENYFKTNLKNLFNAVQLYKPVELVGSSGAFESFIEMLSHRNLGDSITEERTEYELKIQNYFLLADELIKSTFEERINMEGLVPMRVDMIVVCCLMVNFILKEIKLNKFRVSTYSLKEGALIDFLENNK